MIYIIQSKVLNYRTQKNLNFPSSSLFKKEMDKFSWWLSINPL